MALGENFISEVFVVILFGMCFNVSFSYPSSYRELSPKHPTQMTQAPKVVKDNFPLNRQIKTIPLPNTEIRKVQLHKSHIPKFRGDELFDPVTYRVKTANLWKGQRRQNDDNDDDDDDGGEYEGLADNAKCKNKDQDETQEKKSMPMMIIRGFDVMAMDVPVLGGKKECKKPDKIEPPVEEQVGAEPPEVEEQAETEEKPEEQEEEVSSKDCEIPTEPQEEETTGCSTTIEIPEEINQKDSCLWKDSNDPTDIAKDNIWGDWSPCSKSCGLGMQSRSRIKPSGSPELDTQFKPCHLADCSEPRVYEASQMIPSQFGYRQMLNT